METLIPTDSFENNISLIGFTSNFVITTILSLFLGWIYTKYGRSLSNRKSFSRNFTIISMTTMLIITIVKSSLALSLGLVGALSVVRFRTAIKEPEELSYLFLSIALGLGMGANQVLVTIIGLIIIGLFIILRERFGSNYYQNNMILVISCPNSKQNDFENIIDFISENCDRLSIKRLSDNSESFETMIQAEINNYQKLLKLRNNLKNMYPNLSINFIDNSGIEAF